MHVAGYDQRGVLMTTISRTQAGALITDITGLSLTDFQGLLASRTDAVANWLLRAIDACGGEGVSAGYCRLRNPLRGWAPPSPEVTGLVAPTLIRFSRLSGRQDLVSLAVMQARWITSLQYLDGALPGGLVVHGEKGGPSIFSTGQMILPLVTASDQTSNHDFLQSAANAARWLADEVNDAAGTWITHGERAGYGPAYYSRVCWLMLEVWQRTREERIRLRAMRVLDTICSWQFKNGAFRNWGAGPDRPACTHTIADTIRGLLESGRILQDDGHRYTKQASKAALAVRRQLEASNQLAGTYDGELAGNGNYTCLAGASELAGIWVKVADTTGDVEYFRAAIRALWLVMGRLRMQFYRGRNTRGAVAGSHPFWGACMPVSYSTRAAKFFVDALMDCQYLLQQSSVASEC